MPISAVTIARLEPPAEVSPIDPQLATLSCMFCGTQLRNACAVARHIQRQHPNRSDFPVLFFGRVEDPVGSAAMAKLVLKQVDMLLYNGLKIRSIPGRMITAFKRINIKVLCPPGAFDSIVQSFDLKPRWTSSGSLIIDHATGRTIRSMLGPNCLERPFPNYKAVVDEADPVKMKWGAIIMKDHLGIGRREASYLKINLICKSRIATRAPRVQRSMN
jgi:hypothetical protein